MRRPEDGYAARGRVGPALAHGPTAPVLVEIRDQVERRIRELIPALEEWRLLESVLEYLQAGASGGVPGEGRPVLGAGDLRRMQGTTRPGAAGERRGEMAREGRAIIGTALSDPGITAPEICERTGLDETTVVAAIADLERSGDLERFGPGVRVPDRLARPRDAPPRA